MTVVRSYLGELGELKMAVTFGLADSLCSLVLYENPLATLALLCLGVTLVEYPHMAPSCFLLSFAWLMLAMLMRMRQHPSPWRRPPSFGYYLDILLGRKSALSVVQIKPYEGAKESLEREQKWQQRREQVQRLAATRTALDEEMKILGNDKIHTERSGLELDLVMRLSRYTRILGRACRFFRFAKYIILWEYPVLSLFLTLFLTVGGVVSIFLPWAFLMTWTGRIIVWGFLGPHMKFVGSRLRSKSDADDNDAAVERVIDSFRHKSLTARLRSQEAAKIKYVKELCFGPFSTRIPSILSPSRFVDYPLPDSYARWHHHDELSNEIKIAPAYIPGQQCHGGIIPRTEQAAQQYNAEVPRLQSLLGKISDCMQKIYEEEQNGIHQNRFRNAQEELPEAMGYELVSFQENKGGDHDDAYQMRVQISPTNSMLLGTESLDNSTERKIGSEGSDRRGSSSSALVGVTEGHIKRETRGAEYDDVSVPGEGCCSVEVVLAESVLLDDESVLSGEGWNEVRLLTSSDGVTETFMNTYILF